MTCMHTGTSRHVSLIDGECRHCDWYAVTDSYPKMVRMYHDHLRDEHPEAWLHA